MDIAVCDDEAMFAYKVERLTKQYIAETGSDMSLSVFTEPAQFLDKGIKRYDIAFLDVRMGDYNGMDIATRLHAINEDIVIIFVSAYVEYAPRGFEVGAWRYLLKDQLDSTFNRYMREAIEKVKESARTIIIKTTDGAQKTIKIADILYLESLEHNVIIHLQSGEYKTYGTLSNILPLLHTSDFVRIQRSYIVNIRHVTTMRSCALTLANGQELTCSRQLREEVLRKHLQVQGEF